jgi:hypothetical protein
MANNRMFLVYRPTGDAVFLGKRMGFGWYGAPQDLEIRLSALFARSEEAASQNPQYSQDDFLLAMEDNEGAIHAINGDSWDYSKGALDDPLIIHDSVPYSEVP